MAAFRQVTSQAELCVFVVSHGVSDSIYTLGFIQCEVQTEHVKSRGLTEAGFFCVL